MNDRSHGKNFISLALASAILIINGLIAHFLAPGGITLTPIILIITTSLICFATKNIGAICVSVLSFLFIALNDIFIKLFGGGIHDREGLDWIHLFLFIGLVPAFSTLMISLFTRYKERLLIKFVALVLFAGLITMHLKLFSHLGLGRSY